MALCLHPGGAGACAHDRDARLNPVGSTPRLHHQSRLAAVPDSPSEGGHRRTSAKQKGFSGVYYIITTKNNTEAADVSSAQRCDSGLVPHLYLHALWLNDVDLVLVAAPHFIVDDGHAADGVMRSAEVHEVVVGQIPLAI